MITADNVTKDLQKLENKKQKEQLQRFFKTGKGEYGEDDVFLGIKVGLMREIAKRYKDLSLKDIKELLESKIHEHRFTALLILIHHYSKADEQKKKDIFTFYMENRDHVNNWDLVDLSAPKIVGSYLTDKDKTILYDLATQNLWDRRIAILSTSTFIRKNDFTDALAISEILLNDKHDLIHKAVGWMLREIGKKDIYVEETFLQKHYTKMPRTMLRYAIEKFDDPKKKYYMQKR